MADGYGAAGSGVAGVPTGFTRSPDGAVAAVTAWLSTVEGAGLLNARVRQPVLAAIGDPSFASAATGRLVHRAAELGLDGGGRPRAGYVSATVWAVRGAYRVVTYDGTTARIEVWHLYQLGVVSPGAQPGPGVWRRATGTVHWDAGADDWRMTEDFRFAPGPDPKVALPSRLERAEALVQTGAAGWWLYANTQD
jgi:hypothetical protein